jgi:hypothetical protein
MENSLLPCEEWTMKEMKDYIRKKKLNKTKIVLLGMTRPNMIEGLKKLKQFQLPSNEIVSKLGFDVSLLHNLIWDIEEIIIKYVEYYRHLYSLSWGQLSKIYRTNYKLANPGMTCKISRRYEPVALSKLIVKDFPSLTLEDFPKKTNVSPISYHECIITYFEDNEELKTWVKYMMYYYGWRTAPIHSSQRGRINALHRNGLVVAGTRASVFYKKMKKSSFKWQDFQQLIRTIIYKKGEPRPLIDGICIYRKTVIYLHHTRV